MLAVKKYANHNIIAMRGQVNKEPVLSKLTIQLPSEKLVIQSWNRPQSIAYNYLLV